MSVLIASASADDGPPALVAVTTIVLFLTVPGQTYFITPTALIPKLYANSILAILNSRFQILGGRDSQPLPMDFLSTTAHVRNTGMETTAYDDSRPAHLVTIHREIFTDGAAQDQLEMKGMGVRDFSPFRLNPPEYSTGLSLWLRSDILCTPEAFSQIVFALSNYPSQCILTFPTSSRDISQGNEEKANRCDVCTTEGERIHGKELGNRSHKRAPAAAAQVNPNARVRILQCLKSMQDAQRELWGNPLQPR